MYSKKASFIFYYQIKSISEVFLKEGQFYFPSNIY